MKKGVRVRVYIIPISEEDPGYEEGGQSQGVYYTYIRGGSRI